MQNWSRLWCISVLFPYSVLAILLYADGDSVPTTTTQILIIGADALSVCGSIGACIIAPFSVIRRIFLLFGTMAVVHPALFFIFWLVLVLLVGPIQS